MSKVGLMNLAESEEPNDEHFEEILLGKDEYVDLLDLPGDLEKAKTHLIASSIFDESKIDLDCNKVKCL